MTISAVLLTGGDIDSEPGGATSWLLPSITPGANKLITVDLQIARADSTNAVAPTVTGCGLTFVDITPGAAAQYDEAGTYRARIYSFRAMGSSPSTGQLTVTPGSGTYHYLGYDVTEWSGVDTSGTDGSGAVVQVVGALAVGGTNPSITLAALGDAGNATGGFMCNSTAPSSITAGSGYTALVNVVESFASLGPNRYFCSEWRADGQTTVTWNNSTAADWGGIAYEIKAATATPSALPFQPVRRIRHLLVR